MNEWEKCQSDYLYDANYDKTIVDARNKCADLCYNLMAKNPQACLWDESHIFLLDIYI